MNTQDQQPADAAAARTKAAAAARARAWRAKAKADPIMDEQVRAAAAARAKARRAKGKAEQPQPQQDQQPQRGRKRAVPPPPHMAGTLEAAAVVASGDEKAARTVIAAGLEAKADHADWKRIIAALANASGFKPGALRSIGRQMGGPGVIEPEAPAAVAKRAVAEAEAAAALAAVSVGADPDGANSDGANSDGADPDGADAGADADAPAGADKPKADDGSHLHPPPGFVRTTAAWIYQEPMRGEGRPPPARAVCSYFDLLGEVRDGRGGGWSMLLAFRDRDGAAKRATVKRADLLGETMPAIAALVSEGLVLAHWDDAPRMLARLLRAIHTSARVLEVSKVGWLPGGGYVLPDGTSAGTTDTIVLAEALATAAAAALVGKAGTVEGWRDGVALPAMCSHRMVLMICTAFAGPLAGLLGMEGGGSHLVGRSKDGKTTCIVAGCSVWGRPDRHGALRSWRTTDNAVEATAAQHNDRCLALDEIGQAPPAAVAQAAYMLVNGQGRARMTRSGGTRDALTWTLDFLSTGEVSIEDTIAASGAKAKAGQLVRVLDLPSDAGAGCCVFDILPPGETVAIACGGIASAAAEHHGRAGRAFIQRLVEALQQDRDGFITEARARIAAIAADLLPAGATSGQARTAVQRLARSAFAGELASEWGITGWPAGAATRAARACLHAWLRRRGGSEDREDIAVRAALIGFLRSHGPTRFSPLRPDAVGLADLRMALDNETGATTGTGAERVAHDINGRLFGGRGGRAGFYWDTAAGERGFLIFPAVMKEEVLAGLDQRAAGKVLADAGLIERQGAHFSKAVRLPGSRTTVRMCVVPAGAWARDDADMGDAEDAAADLADAGEVDPLG